MKKFLFIAGCVIIVVATSCDGVRRNPGHAYMPDMAYSVAYETYAPTDERLSKYGAHYNNQPVAGTIARGDAFPYKIKNDSSGVTQAASVVNPVGTMNAKDYLEASRLYLVNCAICHGDKLNGNGPLYKDGNGPFSAKPADLMASVMNEGSMFFVATYGKNAMGSYASQLSTMQRWMIVSYIKEKKASGAAAKATTDSTGKAAAKPVVDSTKTKNTK
jgi:mono/diheme cytochrome c family protein